MNFSSHCIDHNNELINKLLKLHLNEDAEKVALVNMSIESAHKFIFPSPDQLNINITYDTLSLMKMPYPVMALEYTLPTLTKQDIKEEKESPETLSTNKMILAFDCSKDIWPVNYLKKTGKLKESDNGIFVLSFYSVDYKKAWIMETWGGYFDKSLMENLDKEDFDVSKDFLHQKGKAKLAVKAIDLLDDYSKNLIINHGPLCNIRNTQKQEIIAPAVAYSIISTIMLNTKNLKEFKFVEAPEKLNKKRIKNKKSPYFDYHTLDLFFDNTGKLINRKNLNYGQIKEDINSVSTLRKLHTVRGHFKVRSTGIFWWSNYTRGSKLAGVIDKDYNIEPERKLKAKM